MTFGENWFSKESQDALAKLAWSVMPIKGSIIEVGCWTGCSTVALANAVHPQTVHAVDTWEGSPGEISAELAAARNVYAEFTRNIGDLTAGNVKIHRMGWRDFFAGWDGRVKFIHIDAEHSYREVRDNIEAVLPLMVPGGVICGDDQHHPPVRDAVTDVLGNALVTASLWHWRADG